MKISITEPCHENWDAMTPNAQGAFCKSCVKDVVDFSTKSLEEIKNFFSKPQTGKICGRFEEKQLTELSFDDFFARFRHWNFSKKFAVIFLLAFGFWIFSGSAAIAQNYMMKGEVMVEPVNKKTKEPVTQQPVQERTNYIKGKIAKQTCTKTVEPTTVKGNAKVEPEKPEEQKLMMMGMVAYRPRKEEPIVKTETPVIKDTIIANNDANISSVPDIADESTEANPDITGKMLIEETHCKILETVLENQADLDHKAVVNIEPTITKTMDIETPKDEAKILIFPNPNNGMFSIETASAHTLYIFDENGKLVLTQDVNGTTKIDATHLRAGVYSVNLLSPDGRITNSIIISK